MAPYFIKSDTDLIHRREGAGDHPLNGSQLTQEINLSREKDSHTQMRDSHCHCIPF